jgi:Pyrimidine dimer DNA glycosylase
MVNTFLPSPYFHKSAETLDYRRLGKQRVEAWQILNALLGHTKGWVNHPATRMWRGHERALCEYGIAVCDEWIKRGYKDTLRPKFIALISDLPDTGMPEWLGTKAFHLSHQSNLKRKDSVYYTFGVTDDLPYQWYDPDVQKWFTSIKGVKTYNETNQD